METGEDCSPEVKCGFLRKERGGGVGGGGLTVGGSKRSKAALHSLGQKIITECAGAFVGLRGLGTF